MNTNKFFQTKQQYLAFRAAFAAAQNNPRAKKGKPNTNGYKEPGWLTASHYMLLNSVRGLPLTRGFSEIANKNKLHNGMPARVNIDAAERNITSRVAAAKSFIENKPEELTSWELPRTGVTLFTINDVKAKLVEEKTAKRQLRLKAELDQFLEPFAGTFTIADLAKLGEQK